MRGEIAREGKGEEEEEEEEEKEEEIVLEEEVGIVEMNTKFVI